MKVGLLGIGTVGTGVYEIINNERGNYFASAKQEVVITKVLVRDINRKRNVDIPREYLTTNVNDILDDEEIKVVICVMGGMETEYEYIMQAMKNGKHVVTANKAVVSEYMDVLFKTAKENEVIFLYEASVGGGIPIISSLMQILQINRIDEIKGILNGTTNFILSKMDAEGWNFEDTLKMAQDLGFAEADPTADIEGYDVSRKLSILSSLAYGSHIRDEDIKKRGITEITAADMKFIQELGYVVKYLAHSKLEEDTYYCTVEPVLLPSKDIMSNVNEEFNIISINGNIIGELQFYGKGAGKDATANAVVGDLMYIINNDFSHNDISLTNQLTNGGVSAFRGRYYLRADSNNYDDFVKIVDSVDEISKKKKIVFNKSKVFVVTDEVGADEFDQLVLELKAKDIDVFYARIYS